MKKITFLLTLLLTLLISQSAWADGTFTKGKPYVIRHSGSGLYLNLEHAGSNAILSSEFSLIYFTASEDGYIISNGTNYLYSNTTEYHAWASSSKSSVWEIEEVDGVADTYNVHQSVYTTTGSGYLGSDATNENSPCFNDKGKTNFTIVEADVLFKLNYLKSLKIPALFKESDITEAITIITGTPMTSEAQEAILTTVYKSAEGKTFYAASNFSGTNKYLNVGDTKATCTSTSLTSNAIMTVEYAGDDKFYLKGNNGKYICTPSSSNNVAPSTTDQKAEAGKFYIGNLNKTTDNLVYFTTQKTNQGNSHEALHFINHTDGLTGWSFRPDASQWQIEAISIGDDDDHITVNYTLTDQNSNTYTGSVSKKFADIYSLLDPYYNPTNITWTDDGKGTFTYSANLTMPFRAAANFAGITNWYNVRMHSNQTHYMYYDSEATNKVTFSNAIGDKTNAYLWGYVGNPIAGFQIYNREAGSSIALDNNNPCTMSASGTSAKFYVTNGTAGTNGSTADFYFAMYATSGSYLNWRSGNTIQRWTSKDEGSTFMINSPTVSYILTDFNGQTYQGSYQTSLIGSEEPSITGCYNYTLSNKAWSGTSFTATIKFPFSVSSNGKNIYTYLANYANHCWKAVGSNIKDFGVIPTSADAAYDWQIIPTLTSNAFSFKIKNRSTGTYIYSTYTGTRHNEGDVTLNATGTALTYTAKGWCFPQTTSGGAALYISENSSTSNDQIIGIYTSHGGTAARFYLPKVTTGFYRVMGGNSGKYVLAGTANSTKYSMGDDANGTAVFYFDGEHLLSYTYGRYWGVTGSNTGGTDRWNWTEVGGTGSVISFPESNTTGKYFVQLPEGSKTGHTTLLYDNTTACDRGSFTNTTSATDIKYTWLLDAITSLPVTISSVGYASFNSPVAVEIPDGVTAFVLSSASESSLSLTSIDDGIIPANTAVVLKGAAGTYNFNITSEAGTATSLFSGTIAAISVTSGQNYTLQNDTEQGVAFYILNNTYIPGFKAYYPKPVSGAKALTFVFDTETGIDNRILEQTGEKIYDLQGRLVEKAGKGIYIVNGKKVFVK